VRQKATLTLRNAQIKQSRYKHAQEEAASNHKFTFHFVSFICLPKQMLKKTSQRTMYNPFGYPREVMDLAYILRQPSSLQSPIRHFVC